MKGVQKVGFPLRPLLKPKENIYLFISILTFIYYLLVIHVLNLIFYEFILNIVSFIIFYFNAMDRKYNFKPRTWEKKMLEKSINDGDIWTWYHKLRSNQIFLTGGRVNRKQKKIEKTNERFHIILISIIQPIEMILVKIFFRVLIKALDYHDLWWYILDK